jgi:6-phosphogluconolactonase
MWRITLTAPAINAASDILFLVAGADKAQTVRAVLRGAYAPDELPAQLVRPAHGRVAWLLDREAAKALS